VAPVSLLEAYGRDGDADEPSARLSPGEAAANLKATLARANFSATDLQQMRRRFAAAYHPDRVPEHARQEAVVAMAEINAEIDRVLKQAKVS